MVKRAALRKGLRKENVMKAVVINEFGGTDKLNLTDVPNPQPQNKEVLVQIYNSGVNPVDWKIREGYLKSRLDHQFPIILGWDAAGVITEVGKDVKNFKVGDEIFAYCRKPTVKWGAYAEYICLDESHVALKPKNISFAQAAAIPLTALTAWQSLFDFGKLKKGETVLIHAGAGGVGSMAIQFAKYAGATILTTASSKNHDYVKKLGANFAIDYMTENFAQKVREYAPKGVDLVYDTLGGKALLQSLDLIKPHGRLVSLLEKLDEALVKKHEIEAFYVFVTPNGSQLAQIADLINAGVIMPPEIEEFRLEDVKLAHEKSSSGHTRGKIVLKVK